METFYAMDTQRAVIQTMESLFILATSRNIETIKGRYDFLLTLIPTLLAAKKVSQFSDVVHTAFEQYKTMYPTSTPQEYQLSAIFNPEEFNLNNFYCSSLVSAIKRYYEKQLEEINTLKKDTTKRKRFEKVIETIKMVQNELRMKCSTSELFLNANIEVETLLFSVGNSYEKI